MTQWYHRGKAPNEVSPGGIWATCTPHSTGRSVVRVQSLSCYLSFYLATLTLPLTYGAAHNASTKHAQRKHCRIG